MSEKMIIAAYGTLRLGHGNNRLFDRVGAKYVGTGKTVRKHTMYASGIPFVKEDGGTSQITVDLFELEKENVGPVDGLEGHPDWYQRRLTPVKVETPVDGATSEGQEIDAWLYFMDSPHGTIIESGDYNDYRKYR